MAIKPALCRAGQSSSFGHFHPSPQTSVTTTPNRVPLHGLRPTQRSTQRPYKNHAKLHHTTAHAGALDKALDMWYTIGVGLKETHKTGTKQ